MAILAIETSTPKASLAVVEAGKVMFEAHFTSQRAHNSLIFQPLAQALEVAGQRLAGIVIGTGPGSYAGVRIGISAGLGIALVQNVPIIGIPSFLTLGDGAIVGDARRGQWHFSIVDNGQFIQIPIVEPEQTTLARCAEFPGPLRTTDASSPAFCNAEVVVPQATALAQMAARFSKSEWLTRAATPPEPYYTAAQFITHAKTPSFQ